MKWRIWWCHHYTVSPHRLCHHYLNDGFLMIQELSVSLYVGKVVTFLFLTGEGGGLRKHIPRTTCICVLGCLCVARVCLSVRFPAVPCGSEL